MPLRPLGLGELLDGSVQTMRHNPRVMFGLSALVMAAVAVVSTLLLVVGVPQMVAGLDPAGSNLTSNEVAGLVSGGIVSFFVPAVLQVLALSVLNGVLVVAVSQAVIGRRPTVGDVVQRVGWAGAGRLVLLTLVTSAVFLLMAGALALPVFLLFLAATPAGVVGIIVGLPVLVCAAVFLGVRLAFAGPALLLEGLGVRASLRRSWRLGLGSFWRVLGILLLTAIIAQFAASILQIPFALIGQVLGFAAAGAAGSSEAGVAVSLVVATAVGGIGSVIGTTVVAPFSASVTCLLYIDLRIRREGLDVALARAAETGAAPAVPGSPRP